MPTLEVIEAQLTGPGGPFEVVEEPVLGEAMPVFKDRHPNLRAILQESVGHGDKEYIVLDDLRISFAEHARIVASVAKGASASGSRRATAWPSWPPIAPSGCSRSGRRSASARSRWD
jgi:hypothetical protein